MSTNCASPRFGGARAPRSRPPMLACIASLPAPSTPSRSSSALSFHLLCFILAVSGLARASLLTRQLKEPATALTVAAAAAKGNALRPLVIDAAQDEHDLSLDFDRLSGAQDDDSAYGHKVWPAMSRLRGGRQGRTASRWTAPRAAPALCCVCLSAPPPAGYPAAARCMTMFQP